MFEEGREEPRLGEAAQARHWRRRELRLRESTRCRVFILAPLLIALLPLLLLFLLLLPLLPLLPVLLRCMLPQRRRASRAPELPLGAVSALRTRSQATTARHFARAFAFLSPARIATRSEQGQGEGYVFGRPCRCHDHLGTI